MADTDPSGVYEALWSGWTGSIGFDVGARNGESIDDFLRRGLTKIVCFEPSEAAYEKLRINALRLGKSRVEQFIETHRSAVSDHTGIVELYSVPGAMSKGELVSPIQGMEWSVAEYNVRNSITVPCISLDKFCEHHDIPDLVKVDTEGHEDKVLEGATTLLDHGSGWIIEFHTPLNHVYCMNRLELSGYEVETIRHPHYAPESPMWHQHGWIRAEKR
jgi:FkbM family methyltransferase